MDVTISCDVFLLVANSGINYRAQVLRFMRFIKNITLRILGPPNTIQLLIG